MKRVRTRVRHQARSLVRRLMLDSLYEKRNKNAGKVCSETTHTEASMRSKQTGQVGNS